MPIAGGVINDQGGIHFGLYEEAQLGGVRLIVQIIIRLPGCDEADTVITEMINTVGSTRGDFDDMGIGQKSGGKICRAVERLGTDVLGGSCGCKAE